MNIKITAFITLLLYVMVISQSIFYILAVSRVMKNMCASAYIETRKLLDKHLRPSLPAVYYAALIATIVLTGFSLINPSGILFICSLIALVALVVDVALSMKGNVPLNKVINSWNEADYPENWRQYRSRWFAAYNIRQIANLTGFVSLLAGIIFGM